MPGEDQPSVGEALKATQAGKLPIGTVKDILDRAPTDLVEEVIEIPEWGCSVRVKSFTAAQSARIKNLGFVPQADGRTVINWAKMEQVQFQEGVIEPKFSEKEVKVLHTKSGRGFQRVIDWLDEKSKMNKEEMKKVSDEFPGSDESEEV